MDAQHPGALLRHDLHEAVGLAEDRGLPRGGPGEAGDLDVVAGVLGLLLREADGGDLGRRVRATGHTQVVDQGGVRHAADLLGDVDALGEGHVGELEVGVGQAQARLGDQVPDRPDPVHTCPAPLVDDDEAALEPDALVLVAEAVGDRAAAGGDEAPLRGRHLGLAVGGLVGHRCPAGRGLGADHLDAGQGPDAPALELARQLGRDLLVLPRSQTGERLEDGHLGPEGAVQTGELQPDRPRPDDGDRGGDVLQGKGLVGGDECPAVDLDEGQGARVRAAGQHDRSRPHRLVPVHLDGVGRDEDPRSGDDADLARLDDGLEAPVELGDDGALVPQDLAPVDGRLAGEDPEVPRRADVVHDLGGMQEGLGRDAAPVQAGPTDLVALDEADAQTELGGAQGAGVAGVAAAEDRHINRFSHHPSLSRVPPRPGL